MSLNQINYTVVQEKTSVIVDTSISIGDFIFLEGCYFGTFCISTIVRYNG